MDRKQLSGIKKNLAKSIIFIYKTNSLFIPVTVVVTVILGITPSISIIVLEKIINMLQNAGGFTLIMWNVVMYVLINLITIQIQNLYQYFLGGVQLKISLNMTQKILKKLRN